MSQLFQVATRIGGQVDAVDGSLAPSYFDQGLPFDAGGLAIDNAGVIDHYWQGIPFTVTGRVCAALAGVVDHITPGGAPFTSAGLIAFGTGAVDHYSAGIPYTATNQIKTI